MLIADKKCCSSNVFIKKCHLIVWSVAKIQELKIQKFQRQIKENKCLHQNLECVIVRNEASRDLGNLIKTAFLPLTLSFLIN